MTWDPTPIDTEGVRVPESLESLREKLAKNTHDVWARQRLADGWRQGPERDDAKKTHPSLVPYDELPESEKEYDRVTSQETLRAILKLGYRIVPPPRGGGDEMHDHADDLDGPGRLKDYLRACADVLVEPFKAADEAALRDQGRHRETTRTGATALSAAIIVAAILTVLERPLGEEAVRIGLVFEAMFALLALAAVVYGHVRYSREGWLLERARAEQIRLLKFRALGDAGFWCAPAPGPEEIRRRLQRELERLPASEERLDEISQGGSRPPAEPVRDCSALEPGLFESIRDYYQRRRLSVQQSYFEARAERRRGRWYDNPRILPLVFFASLAFVGLHVALRFPAGAEDPGSPIRFWSDLFAAMAAILPAAWAGVRTYKQANEFLRNRGRARARRCELDELAVRLDAAPDPLAGFAAISLCEFVLALDQAEWLRVMGDAEWYGG
jgi:hypothetical protein